MNFLLMHPAADQASRPAARQIQGNEKNQCHAFGIAAAVLALTLSASGLRAQVWTELAPSGGPPAARANFGTAQFDPTSGAMIIFAGQNSGGNLNDVWVLVNPDGLAAPQWVNLTPTPDPVNGSPAPRNAASVVYDPTGNRLIIFDGCLGNCTPIANDLWVLTNANGLGGTPAWIKLSPSGPVPQPRENMASVYDPASNKMIVFGGQNGCCGNQQTYSDVWVLNNANGLGGTQTWSQLSPSGGPPAGQTALSAVYDSINNRMTVFGGLPNILQTATNAVWVLSNANGQGGSPVWTNLVAEGAAGSPPARFGHTAVYDSASNSMTIFGGEGASLFNDTWVLTNANGFGGTSVWTQLAPSGGPPAARVLFGAVWTPISKRMTIFAGGSATGSLNDVWVLATGLPVPTDKDACKNGGWQNLGRADGSPFKNQGDCIQ